MKKTVALAVAVVICLAVLFAGCTPSYSETPDKNKDIRWIAYDYSFCINPAEDCTGYYTVKDNKFNIKVTFDGSMLKAVDTDNNDTELFVGDWIYETSNSGATLLNIYNLQFNKSDYPVFENYFAEFVNLKQEKIASP